MLIEKLAPRRRTTIRHVGIRALALLGWVLGAMPASRVEAYQATTDAPPPEGRSRLSTQPKAGPSVASAPAPYLDPWQDIRYEDLALLVKTARRALKSRLAAGAEIAPGYTPPSLKGKDGIIVLRLRSNSAVLCEAASPRMPVVEAANAAGLAIAQTVAKANVKCDRGGDALGLELEWLGPNELVGPNFAQEGHWTDELLHSFEPGVEGIAVEFQGKQAWTCPSEIITRNYSPDLALAAAETKAGIQFIHKIRLGKEIRYSRFPAIHLWQPDSSVLPFRLLRGAQLVEREAVNARGLDEAIARMRRYLRYLQMADGGFAEEFNPSADRFDHGPTPRLQMSALSSLVALYQWTGQDGDKERLKRCTDRAISAAKPLQRATKDDKGRVTVEDVGLALQFPGESECLEPTARLLLAKLAIDPGAKGDSAAKELAKAILAGQGVDGRLELRLESGATDSPESISAGVWGMRALIVWDGSGRDAAVSAVLEQARTHYQSWYERDAEPRASAALARALMQLYGRTNDARCSDLAFSILDRFAALQVTPASCPMPELWGAINAGQPGVVGSDSAAYVSALAEGLVLARRIGDRQRVERYEHAVRLGARFILQLEFTEAGCFYVRTPRDAIGGVRMSPWDHRIRVDRCGDALESLIQARGALFGKPARRGE